ncbi:calponin-1-like [Notothenia coriiceps]|uniref:Calponin-1-like n=1 Tax=Notothenia coriiceps TaxID=8208 RepID=A0A6I9P0Q9_9TELE|nr:PREDICTED: calponin-1-like [Notothenia coriiceps]
MNVFLILCLFLCRLINVLQPGSVRKISQSTQNWHQLENIGNFVRAITEYGLRPDDIFEANDLFENTNYTQVQSTLLALTGMAKSKGFHSKYDLGVKYAEKHQRRFAPEKLKEGRNVIGLQVRDKREHSVMYHAAVLAFWEDKVLERSPWSPA